MSFTSHILKKWKFTDSNNKKQKTALINLSSFLFPALLDPEYVRYYLLILLVQTHDRIILSLDGLDDAGGVSSSYLQRLFGSLSEYTGCSPKELMRIFEITGTENHLNVTKLEIEQYLRGEKITFH